MGSISRHLSQLKAGDESAIQPLWEIYLEKLVAWRRKVRNAHALGPVEDEEDLAASAFRSCARRSSRAGFRRSAIGRISGG